MIENSRLTKEIQDAVKGKMPANIIPQEIADKCFAKISSILGPTARGSLLDEITLLCNEFVKMDQEYMVSASQTKKLAKEKEVLEKVIKGDDIDDGYEATQLISKVSRLRGVLEVIKTRLDRLCTTSVRPEIVELRNSVSDFLSGDKNV